MSAIVARRCYVSGRVQGVFYRASTRAKATELSVSGYARNLPDGRVEVLMVGELQAVEKLMAWLRIGSPAAEVTHVEVEALDAPNDLPVGFASR